MSTKENKELVSQFYKEWNAFGGDAAKIRSSFEKYYAPNYSFRNPAGENMNLEQTIQFCIGFSSAFPDLNTSIDDMIAEGDKVVTKCTMKGTHKGTYRGIPATGKQINVEQVMISKIVGGRVVEEWEIINSLGMMTQLGVIPGAGAKK